MGMIFRLLKMKTKICHLGLFLKPLIFLKIIRTKVVIDFEGDLLHTLHASLGVGEVGWAEVVGKALFSSSLGRLKCRVSKL